MAYFNQRFNEKSTIIACITEPYLYNQKVSGINCGSLLYDNSDSKPPRAGLVFRKNIQYMPIFEFVQSDFVAAEVELKLNGANIKLAVASGYHDGTKNVIPSTLIKFINYCKKEHKEFIYCCDSNAHHGHWGSKKTDKRGEEILKFISENNLTLLNKGGKSTYFRVKTFNGRLTKVEENIDLTLASNFITHKIFNWKVSDDYAFSDHCYIDFNVKASKPNPNKFRNPKLTNWENYRKLVGERLKGVNLLIRNEEQLDQSVNKFTKILIDCYHASNKEKELCTNIQNDWWNENLNDMKKNVRKLQRDCKSRPSDLTPYKAALNDYNKAIDMAKANSYKKAMSDLNTIPTTSRMHKLLSKDHSNIMGTVLKQDGTYTKTEEESLRDMAKIHFPGHDVSNYPPHQHISAWVPT